MERRGETRGWRSLRRECAMRAAKIHRVLETIQNTLHFCLIRPCACAHPTVRWTWTRDLDEVEILSPQRHGNLYYSRVQHTQQETRSRKIVYLAHSARSSDSDLNSIIKLERYFHLYRKLQLTPDFPSYFSFEEEPTENRGRDLSWTDSFEMQEMYEFPSNNRFPGRVSIHDAVEIAKRLPCCKGNARRNAAYLENRARWARIRAV